MPSRFLRCLPVAAALLLAGVFRASPIAAAGVGPGCVNPTAPLTVEESRLTARLDQNGPAVGPELIRQAGFDHLVADFATRLCATPPAKAQTLAANAGLGLWRAAVARARQDAGADRIDDRPLYWARLAMTKAVRQWTAPLSTQARAAIIAALDRSARGVDGAPPAPRGVRQALVSGFDPFGLAGSGVRNSNPAGAAALRLDGRVLDTPHGPVQVRAVVLPVLWGAFDDGIVEAAFGLALRRPASRPDLLMTISQGRPGAFDIERWAGDRRGGEPDNDNATASGPVPPAAGWPQPRPQFIQTTLPHARMTGAHTGPYPVRYDQAFCQWPAGQAPGEKPPVCQASGDPDLNGTAAAGSGGDYLSNESMYRANRLRLGLGLTGLAGGHLHVPVLKPPTDPTALTSPAFEADRRAITDQTAALLRAAL